MYSICRQFIKTCIFVVYRICRQFIKTCSWCRTIVLYCIVLYRIVSYCYDKAACFRHCFLPSLLSSVTACFRHCFLPSLLSSVTASKAGSSTSWISTHINTLTIAHEVVPCGSTSNMQVVLDADYERLGS